MCGHFTHIKSFGFQDMEVLLPKAVEWRGLAMHIWIHEVKLIRGQSDVAEGEENEEGEEEEEEGEDNNLRFRCSHEGCEARFSSQGNVRRHIRAKHEGRT